MRFICAMLMMCCSVSAQQFMFDDGTSSDFRVGGRDTDGAVIVSIGGSSSIETATRNLGLEYQYETEYAPAPRAYRAVRSPITYSPTIGSRGYSAPPAFNFRRQSSPLFSQQVFVPQFSGGVCTNCQ
jgi:hypothetical protein